MMMPEWSFLTNHARAGCNPTDGGTGGYGISALLLLVVTEGQMTHWFAHDSGNMLVRVDGPGKAAMLGRGSKEWWRQPAFDEFRWCDPGMDWDEVDETTGQRVADALMAKDYPGAPPQP